MKLRSSNEERVVSAALGLLLQDENFRFERLTISGLDNEPVYLVQGPGARREEVCLVYGNPISGDRYLALLGDRVERAANERRPLPVVRFADGEYEFYKGSLKCNGLYQQAESGSAIRSAMPGHLEALRYLAEHGILSPLIYPGNVRRQSMMQRLLRKRKEDDSALRFLGLLEKHGLRLTGSNYVPFYAVYAYLSSVKFAQSMSGKAVCIVNSDFNEAAVSGWFERAGSQPRLIHVPIAESFVATRWDSMREEVFRNVPKDADCLMVGAGVGALQVCVDAARRFGVPAIDSGHILNMMNDLERKSQGPRLYTFRR